LLARVHDALVGCLTLGSRRRLGPAVGWRILLKSLVEIGDALVQASVVVISGARVVPAKIVLVLDYLARDGPEDRVIDIASVGSPVAPTGRGPVRIGPARELMSKRPYLRTTQSIQTAGTLLQQARWIRVSQRSTSDIPIGIQAGP
jgi:hypothetical protein